MPWFCVAIVLAVVDAVSSFPSQWFPLDPQVGDVAQVSWDVLKQRFRGKSALVVGGTDGIGSGTAIAMAQAGASVAVVGHNKTKGQSVLVDMAAVASFGKEQHFQAYIVDLFTVRGTFDFLKQLKGNKTRFDFVVLTVGMWPNWKDPSTTDGLDKVIALDVMSRFLVTKEIVPLLNKGARVLSTLASTWRMVFWRDMTTISASTMKDIATGERKYSLPEILATASTMNDAWMQGMSKIHVNTSYIGTFPGVVATDLLDHGTFPKWLIPFVNRAMKAAGMAPEECGRFHATIISSPNALARNVTYFSVNQKLPSPFSKHVSVTLEGRFTNNLAYDADFGRWAWSFLQGAIANHTTRADGAAAASAGSATSLAAGSTLFV